MPESDAAPTDADVLRDLDPVDRVHAAELAILLFLCPGLTSRELDALETLRTDPNKSGQMSEDEP